MRFAFIFAMLALPLTGSAQQNQESTEKSVYDVLYADLKKVESFGFIHVHIKNSDGNPLGLSSQDLTDHLKLRYKNSFANVPFRDQSKNLMHVRDPEKVGYFWCGVWTVGDNYPVAYHVECRAGSFANSSILKDAVLGYGNKKNVPDTVKESISNIVSEFAIRFFKTRGEM
jgi:hypothetical protein